MNVIQTIGDGMPAIDLTHCDCCVNMFRRGFSSDLVEMNHTTSISGHFVYVKLDALDNCLYRSLLNECCIDTGGDKRILVACICLDTLRPDLV